MKNKLIIKPFYSSSEIARLINMKTSVGARRWLLRSGVPLVLIGGKYCIFLSDISIYCPELLASLIEVSSLNAQNYNQNTDLVDDPEEDEEDIFPTTNKYSL